MYLEFNLSPIPPPTRAKPQCLRTSLPSFSNSWKEPCIYSKFSPDGTYTKSTTIINTSALKPSKGFTFLVESEMSFLEVSMYLGTPPG